MDKKKKLVKNTLIIFFGRVSTQFIGFLLLPLYTSFLTTSDYGIVDLITTYVVLLIPIITLELEMSVFRYLIDVRGKIKETKRIISNNFYVLFKSLTIFVLLYLLLSSIFDFDYKWIILLDIVICTFNGNFLQIARGLGDNVGYAISCIITGLSTILFNILFIVGFDMGATGMLLAILIANGLGAIFLFFREKLYKKINFKLKDNTLIKEMRKYSLPLVPNSISWWIVNAADRTIIALFLTTSANGIYAVANKFPTILSALLGIFNLSWSESAALNINSKDRDKFFSEVTNTVFKLFSSLGVGMIAVLPFLFPILIDSSFNEAYNYIPILVLGAVFNVLICIYTGIYIAKKETKKVMNTTIIGAIINILFNVIFIHFIGLYAAAISTALSYLAMLVYRHFEMKKVMNIKLEKNLILKSVAIFVFAIVLYYINNLYLNIFSLLIVILYSYILNKGTLEYGKRLLTERIKKNQEKELKEE